jgi:hypothetical protein
MTLALVLLAALGGALVIIGLARIPDPPDDPLGSRGLTFYYRNGSAGGWNATKYAGRRHVDKVLGRAYPWPPDWRPRSESEYRLAIEAGWRAPDDWWPGHRDDDELRRAGVLPGSVSWRNTWPSSWWAPMAPGESWADALGTDEGAAFYNSPDELAETARGGND